MRQIYPLTLSFLLCCGSVFSQNCPDDWTPFTTQEQIDNFATNYPECTVLGNLRIGNSYSTSTITNLDGLSQITSITYLTIQNNPDLTNLTGLQNIANINYVVIDNNGALESLTGLEGLTEVYEILIQNNDVLPNLQGINNLASADGSDGLSVIDNDGLLNLSGLDNLTSVFSLTINNNDNLLNLTGLENVNIINGVSIANNDGLTSLDGLDSFGDNISGISIDNNDALTNLNGLENLTDVGHTISIKNNDALTSLDGLSNFNSTRNLIISYNPLLTNLQGLEQLTSIHGYEFGLVIVENNMMTDLSGMQSIDIINDLFIKSNDALTSLNGLGNITELNDVTIENNNALTNLSGLDNITDISELNIENNDALTDLSELTNLTEIDRLFITNNDVLTDISALSNLTDLYYLSIRNNLSLPNLNGLENVVNVPNSFSIIITGNAALSDISGLNILSFYANIRSLYLNNNPNLSMCSEEGLCYYLATGSPAYIYANATGCNSVDEILSMCTIDSPPCPPGGMTFTSQTQIDSFAINYPDCYKIFGHVMITSDGINNLNGLSQITTVDGNLSICDNPLLTNISDLNFRLLVNGNLWIKNNDALIENDRYIDFNGQLIIEDNAVLENLIGIDNYGIADNITFLIITDNPNLSYCGVVEYGGQGICDYVTFDLGPYVIANNAPGCSDEAEIAGNCGFFSVELTDFQAKTQHKTVLLTWETATESNNAGFEIQRSKDGTTWERIAWQEGQGTSTTLHRYNHTDKNPLFGRSYYRLKQIDFDGTSEYSDIVTVNYRSTTVGIYPNPVKETLYINAGNIQQLSIYDQAGRLINSQNTSENIIDVSALSSGLYILKMYVENEIFYEKFIVK